MAYFGKACITAAVLAIAPFAASASVFDFEDFTNGATVASVTSSDGLISASVSAFDRVPGRNPLFQAGTARAFDTAETNTADPDLEIDFLNDDTGVADTNFRPGNVLIIQNPRTAPTLDDNQSGGTITFDFTTGPVGFTGFTIVDDADISVTATLLGGGLFNVGSFSVDRDRGFDVFSFGEVADVTSLTFDFGTASGAIDGLTFTSPTPVPVPAALPLLLAGLGGLGAVARRRKSRAS